MINKIKQILKTRTTGQKKRDIPINVNHEQQYIYIHIPKNAGSSISDALGTSQVTHATAIEVKEKIGEVKFEKYLKFTFVRNPFDRFLSLYNYARLEESTYHSAINPEKALWGKHLDYDLLKNATLEQCANYLIKGRLKHDNGWFHWQPQYKWLVDSDDKICMDFIGKYEFLNEDFNLLTQKIRIKNALPHINQSVKINRNYRELLGPNTIKILSNYYSRDIELFGYEF